MKNLVLFFGILLSISSSAQPGFTMLSQHQETPNSSDSVGVFCRTFYHPARDKYYTVYAGGQGTGGPMNSNRWREYDASYTFTGTSGILPGVTSAGDFAMEQVGTDYYHVSASGNWDFKLSRFDEDFNLINSVTFTLDSSDSRADMLLNYCNGKLIIGAMHVPGEYHPTMPMQIPTWQPVMHKWEYDLTLTPLGPSVYLNEVWTTWGASCIYINNQYNIVTMRKWPQYSLNVYRYDNNWNYIDSVHLNADGQWSQGVVWDGTNIFLSYHSGNEHRSGNITLASFDSNWNLQYDTTITNYAVFILNVSPDTGTTEYNANRPFLVRKGDTLVVSYDVDDYELISYIPKLYWSGQRWQAHVDFWRINSPSGIAENTTQDVSIFPNPANDVITIRNATNQHLTIYNSLGQVVMETRIDGSEQKINLSSLMGGIYNCVLTNENGSAVTRKIVVN
jgi:hypothetical protein